MKVCKFGGSSLYNAEQFQKVWEIINRDPACQFVVVSVPGKRFANDKKVTDALYECFEAAKNGENAEDF